jgi:hypothetical protein
VKKIMNLNRQLKLEAWVENRLLPAIALVFFVFFLALVGRIVWFSLG